MDTLIDRLLALDPRLRRSAARLAPDPQEAEDLVQDVWLAVLTRFPAADVALEPWAMAVLRNQAARRARRPRHGATGVELDQLADAASAQETIAERIEVAAHLRACIESLPEPYRGTLIERFYASRSVGDIAAARGLPRATVSTHLQRALARLRSRLRRAHDLLGMLPGLRWWKRGDGAVNPMQAAAVMPLRSLALAGLVSPLVLVIAWARSSSPPASEERVLAALAPLDTQHRPQAPAEPSSSRVALPFEAANVAPSLRVQVRDARSGQALAGAALSVWSEAQVLHERIADAQGRCMLPAELSDQWLSVGIVPMAWESGTGTAPSGPDFRVFARAKSGELNLEFGRGPLLHLRLRPPAQVHPAELVYGMRSARPGSLSSPRLAVGASAQPGVWAIQLPVEHEPFTSLSEFVLHAATQDGLLAGEALIRPDSLSLREPLELELEPRAALSLALHSANSVPIRSCVIRIRPKQGADAWIAEPRGDGTVWVSGLRPGPYSIEVIAPGRAAWSREVELRAAALESVSARLQASAELPVAGEIHGRVVRAEGSYDGAALMVLEGGSAPQFQRLKWEACAEGFEARFHFPEVEAQSALLRPIAVDGLPRFEPPVHELPASGEPVVFRCLGERAAKAIACEVRSAADGALLSGFELEFELAGGTRVRCCRAADGSDAAARWAIASHGITWKLRSGSPWDWFDAGQSARWRLTAPGFEGQSGDENAWSTGTLSIRLQPVSGTAEAVAARER